MEPASRPKPAGRLRGHLSALLFLPLLLLILSGSYRRIRSRLEVRQALEYLDLTGSVAPSPPVHARPGERWSFRVASLYDRQRGEERREVLSVSPSGVIRRRHAPGSGGQPEEGTWTFEVPAGLAEVLGRREDVIQVSGRRFPCDVVQIDTRGGVDRLRLWIAMDRQTDRPTFPGLLRLEREELRGRRAVEWDLISIAPVESAP